MELYAEREGNAQCQHAQFDEMRGIKIEVFMRDGVAFVKIPGVAVPFAVVEGLPLKLTVYKAPQSSDSAKECR